MTKDMDDFWRSLFRRTTVRRRSNTTNALPSYSFVIYGSKRKLTPQLLRDVENVENHKEEEDDASSSSSFYSCRSYFQDNVLCDSTVASLQLEHGFEHYLSRSAIKSLSLQLWNKMKRHFEDKAGWSDDDTMNKYLCPGIGWEAQMDEIDPNVKTIDDARRISGNWKTIVEESDDPTIIADIMGLPWIFKTANKLIQYIEVTKM